MSLSCVSTIGNQPLIVSHDDSLFVARTFFSIEKLQLGCCNQTHEGKAMQSFYSTMIQEMYQLFIVPYVFISASCTGIFSWMPTVETCSYWINPETWTTSVPFLSPHPCALISHPSMVLDRASSTKASICAVTAILWIGWKKLMSDTARNCGWSQYPLTLPVTGFPAGCCDLTGSFKAWHWDLGSCLWWHVSAVILFEQEIYQDHSISPNLNINIPLVSPNTVAGNHCAMDRDQYSTWM